MPENAATTSDRTLLVLCAGGGWRHCAVALHLKVDTVLEIVRGVGLLGSCAGRAWGTAFFRGIFGILRRCASLARGCRRDACRGTAIRSASARGSWAFFARGSWASARGSGRLAERRGRIWFAWRRRHVRMVHNRRGLRLLVIVAYHMRTVLVQVGKQPVRHVVLDSLPGRASTHTGHTRRQCVRPSAQGDRGAPRRRSPARTFGSHAPLLMMSCVCGRMPGI